MFDTEGIYPGILGEYSPEKINFYWKAMNNGDLDRLKKFCGTRFSSKKWGNTNLPDELKSLVKELEISGLKNGYIPEPTLACPCLLKTPVQVLDPHAGPVYFRQGCRRYSSIPLRDSIPSSFYEKEDA